MIRFAIFWLDGTKGIIEGQTEKDAFIRAGYGQGALRAVDFIADNAEELDNYDWDPVEKKWKSNNRVPKEKLKSFVPKLTNGMIPAFTECPYNHMCELAVYCIHKGKEHTVPFSCASARAFEIE